MAGGAPRSPLARNAILVGSVGAAYFLGAQVGIELRFPPATTSVIWPPNALLTAALLLTAPNRWWLCLAAALPAHVVAEALAGFSPALIATLFVTNCLEALVAAAAVRHWSDEPARFDTLQRALAFVGGAVMLGPFVSSFADAAAVRLLRGEPYELVFLRRMLSNCLSQLVLVPTSILLLQRARDWLTRSSSRRRAEAVLLAVTLGVVGGLVFSEYPSRSSFLPAGPYTSLPFLLPILVFAAVRFGPGGASLSLLASALIAIGSALSGWTPLAHAAAEERVVALQVFLVVVGVPLLLVSALMSENQQIADTLRERLRFEELLSQLAGAFDHLPSDQMDPELAARLARVGAFLEVDRVSLYRFADGAQALVPVAWWFAPDATAPPRRVERPDFPWAAERLLRQELFVCPDPSALPPQARADAALMRRFGVRSALALPLLVGDEVLGALSLVTTTRGPRAWSDAFIRNCRLLADIFGGVLSRKLVEDALRASEAMKSAVLASLTSLVAVLDRDGRIIAVNESWTRFAREHASAGTELIGQGASYLDVCRRAAERGDEQARDALDGIEAVLGRRRSSFVQEYGVPLADGDRWFHMTAVPLDRPEGGAVVSHTDVTERRVAELEAAKSRLELAHFLRVSTVGELTTSIAHELNQPLAAILANAQTARKLLAAPETEATRREIGEIVSDIIEEDRRAGDVIRGLRELLRKGEQSREELDVNDLVRGVLRLLANDVMLRGVVLRPDLAREALTTRGDRVQLQQVLLNLVMNALEALADCDGERRIGIRTERAPGGMARISVEDSGPGLPAPVRQDAFKPFFTTKPKGMGMGLSIARSIVGAHGGTIAADEAGERGARFSFTLPLVEQRPSEAPMLG